MDNIKEIIEVLSEPLERSDLEDAISFSIATFITVMLFFMYIFNGFNLLTFLGYHWPFFVFVWGCSFGIGKILAYFIDTYIID